MSSWIPMGVAFGVGLLGGAGLSFAFTSTSSPKPAASAPDPILDIDGNPLPTVNPFKGGKRRRTKRSKKHGHKKTSRR